MPLATAPAPEHDRVAGALALSALGDALGLPQEAAGLRGQISPWPNDADAWQLPLAQAFREPEPNPWNIWPPAALTHNLPGVISDDTATRLVLIEPWLREQAELGRPPHHTQTTDWIDWLQRRRPPHPLDWCEAMAHAQADDWLNMFRLADATSDPADPPAQACNTDNQPGCFYRPDQPACFGAFLHLTATLTLPNDTTPRQAFQPFAGACRLDQHDGHPVLGLLAALTLPRRTSFAEHWDRVIADVLLDHPKLQARLQRSLHDIGQRSRSLTPSDFLQTTKTELYDHPDTAPTHTLKPFDPALQLSQLAAYVGYAPHDPGLILQLAARGPGDTDTLAATAGLILGANLGLHACQNQPFDPALQTVQNTTAQLFGPTLAQRVACYLPPAATKPTTA